MEKQKYWCVRITVDYYDDYYYYFTSLEKAVRCLESGGYSEGVLIECEDVDGEIVQIKTIEERTA